jgi:hypothetical protein
LPRFKRFLDDNTVARPVTRTAKLRLSRYIFCLNDQRLEVSSQAKQRQFVGVFFLMQIKTGNQSLSGNAAGFVLGCFRQF